MAKPDKLKFNVPAAEYDEGRPGKRLPTIRSEREALEDRGLRAMSRRRGDTVEFTASGRKEKVNEVRGLLGIKKRH